MFLNVFFLFESKIYLTSKKKKKKKETIALLKNYQDRLFQTMEL